MNVDASEELRAGWKLLAGLLIYPLTILAGLNALLRIISGCCVTLDSWTPEGALGNFMLGFPALAGLAALWLSTIQDSTWTARDRVRFVLVVTGLMTGMVMELNFLRSGFVLAAPRFRSPRLDDLWTFGGPLLVAATNLLLLIRARERLFTAMATVPGEEPLDPMTRFAMVPEPALHPVRLQPFSAAQPVHSRAS